jgi:uncharacterized protein YjbI with pentapeptide repeats
MANPEMKSNPMYQLLKEGQVEEFNRRRAAGESCDLRHADLRGIDLSHTNLQGASINSAKISGTYFPPSLSAEEITLSLVHGTRLRYR